MKKRKGFTLIELLAVIVILAIIALIATPIVMNVIENSRKGAAERSAENHLSAIETAIMTGKMDSGEFLSDGTYDLDTLENKLGAIEVSGTKATNATIIVKDGQVIDGSTLTINNYIVNIMDGVGKVGEFGTIVSDVINQTTVIQYDPVANAPCTSDDTCYNWYVLDNNETEYAYVKLIMNKNIGDMVAWCKSSEANTSCEADNAKEYLESQTHIWNVNVTLPTYVQIQANINSNNRLPIWLQAGLNSSVLGYWTSTPVNSQNVYTVTRDFEIGKASASVTELIGVRPVITVLKSQL